MTAAVLILVMTFTYITGGLLGTLIDHARKDAK